MSYRGASLALRLAAEASRQVVEIGRREGATPFMTLLAAFALLMGRTARQESLVVGMAIANRTFAEIENLIGFFVNMLPLRVDLSGSPSFRGLLRRVREVCLGAQAYQNLPLDKLIEAVRPERSAEGSPLFRIAFGLQNAPQDVLELPGLQLQAFDRQVETARFDLTVWISGGEEGFEVRWTYSTELFEESTVRRLHDDFVDLLEGLLARPDAGIETVRMRLAETREASRHAKLLQARPKKVRVQADGLKEG